MIIRSKHDKRNPYLTISMKILRDRRLSSEERDCLIMMLSNSDNWEFSYTGLASQLGIRRETVKTRVQSLIEKGYVSVSYPIGENGKPLPFAKGTWEIREEPITNAGFTGTRKPAHTCLISRHEDSGTIEQALESRHEDSGARDPAQRITEGTKGELLPKEYQVKNDQGMRMRETEKDLSLISSTPNKGDFSGESSSGAKAPSLGDKNIGEGQVISQTDLTVNQAFNKFCEVYPNLADKNMARAAFFAIPNIRTLCWQIVQSVEWFEKNGKWDNWQTGQKNVSCPQAAKFLNRGDWEQYMKANDVNDYANSEAYKEGAELWRQIEERIRTSSSEGE